MAGPLVSSYSYTGRRSSCRVYQSVLSREVLATTTSLRTPSTSCAYHNGNVSLSPTTTSTPYGSTEFSRSRAKSAVSVCPRRDAVLQFVNNGMSASASTGDALSHEVLRGSSTSVPPSLTFSLPNNDATDSQMNTSPRPAHTPQAEKLHK